MSRILAALLKSQQWNSIWFSVLTHQSSFSPLQTCAPWFLPVPLLHNGLHSVQGEPVIVVFACFCFFFPWCVAHVKNTIQVLLSFSMTWFPLWKFKTFKIQECFTGVYTCSPVFKMSHCGTWSPATRQWP